MAQIFSIKKARKRKIAPPAAAAGELSLEQLRLIVLSAALGAALDNVSSAELKDQLDVCRAGLSPGEQQVALAIARQLDGPAD